MRYELRRQFKVGDGGWFVLLFRGAGVVLVNFGPVNEVFVLDDPVKESPIGFDFNFTAELLWMSGVVIVGKSEDLL